MTCGIYKIQNKINGKIYIGQSINIEQRWRAHKIAGNNINHENNHYPLYKEMYEYGIENFNFSIIEECLQEELDNRERYYIKEYNSMIPNGYNQTSGGQTGAHPNKLTYDQVVEIRFLLKETKESGLSLASRFGVSKDTISSINEGHSWYEDGIDFPIRPMKFLICKNCGSKVAHGNKTGLCGECYKQYRKRNKLEKINNKIIQDKIKKESKINLTDREELKKLIRVMPFTQVGKQFGVTDNAIRKWCKNYNLPFRKTDINKYSDEEWDLI